MTFLPFTLNPFYCQEKIFLIRYILMKKYLILFFAIFFYFVAFSVEKNNDKDIKKSIELIKLGKLEDAFVIVNEHIEENPTDEFYYLQGVIYERLEDYKHAYESFNMVISDYSSNYREIAYISAISCLEHLKDFKKLKVIMKDFVIEFTESKYYNIIKKRLEKL